MMVYRNSRGIGGRWCSRGMGAQWYTKTAVGRVRDGVQKPPWDGPGARWCVKTTSEQWCSGAQSRQTREEVPVLENHRWEVLCRRSF